MMRKAFGFFSILIIVASLLLSEIKNADKPLRGEWDFKPAKLWEIDSAGSDVFGIPANMQLSDVGYESWDARWMMLSLRCPVSHTPHPESIMRT